MRGFARLRQALAALDQGFLSFALDPSPRLTELAAEEAMADEYMRILDWLKPTEEQQAEFKRLTAGAPIIHRAPRRTTYTGGTAMTRTPKGQRDALFSTMKNHLMAEWYTNVGAYRADRLSRVPPRILPTWEQAITSAHQWADSTGIRQHVTRCCDQGCGMWTVSPGQRKKRAA